MATLVWMILYILNLLHNELNINNIAFYFIKYQLTFNLVASTFRMLLGIGWLFQIVIVTAENAEVCVANLM